MCRAMSSWLPPLLTGRGCCTLWLFALSQEDFRRGQQAFDTLSNPELRSNYDATYAPEQSMMDQIEGDDMFKCYVELKK